MEISGRKILYTTVKDPLAAYKNRLLFPALIGDLIRSSKYKKEYKDEKENNPNDH